MQHTATVESWKITRECDWRSKDKWKAKEMHTCIQYIQNNSKFIKEEKFDTWSTILCLRMVDFAITFIATLSPVSVLCANLTLAKVPSPIVRPTSYFPTFLVTFFIVTHAHFPLKTQCLLQLSVKIEICQSTNMHITRDWLWIRRKSENELIVNNKKHMCCVVEKTEERKMQKKN